ncbi:MAG: YHYH domain-containing protein [Clostridium sp.]
MSLKRKALRAAMLSVLFMTISFTAWGHPGRTDSSGGHYDRSTGEYHYHHGYPAHQHPGGVCPYDIEDKVVPTFPASTEFRSSIKTDPIPSTKSYSSETKKAEQPNPTETSANNVKTDSHIKSNDVASTYCTIFFLGVIFSSMIWARIASASKKSACNPLIKENATLRIAKEQLESEYENMLASRDELNSQYKDSINQNAQFKKDLEHCKEVLAENKTLSEENTELKNKLHHYMDQVDSLLHIDDTSGIMTYDEIIEAAKVPDGVSFDGNDLPHYYRDATVESRMTVYIAPNGTRYHRTFGCSGAYESIHLFTAAGSRIPCSKCIPFAAMNYKVPEWYYRYLQLVTRQDRLKERNSTESGK